MEYRIKCAETEEQREKEQNYTGLGLTSRKNLCLHPEVCLQRFISLKDSGDQFSPPVLHGLSRYRKRRKARLLMLDAVT